MIGYYVHHHGRGHLTRARCVAAALGVPVTALTSLPRPDRPHPFADWVQLPADDEPDPCDVTAGGALHWAPLRASGYSRRMQRLAAWVRDVDPDAVVVDVSVEVATLTRLLGVPVVVVAGPGRRHDAPHRMVYDLAGSIVAPWPKNVYEPAFLEPHGAKVRYVGGFSRFDGWSRAAAGNGRKVLVLMGGGGGGIGAADISAAARATPHWSWRAYGGDQLPWTGDVWSQLQASDVVVSHAGLNAIAEIAAAQRPALLLPQERPFGEQHDTAAALVAAGLAMARPRWPSPREWPALLDDCARLDGRRWSAWNAGDGAERAAAAIRQHLRCGER